MGSKWPTGVAALARTELQSSLNLASSPPITECAEISSSEDFEISEAAKHPKLLLLVCSLFFVLIHLDHACCIHANYRIEISSPHSAFAEWARLVKIVRSQWSCDAPQFGFLHWHQVLFRTDADCARSPICLRQTGERTASNLRCIKSFVVPVLQSGVRPNPASSFRSNRLEIA